jgi:uncharacterized protein (DUF39 family)
MAGIAVFESYPPGETLSIKRIKTVSKLHVKRQKLSTIPMMKTRNETFQLFIAIFNTDEKVFETFQQQ